MTPATICSALAARRILLAAALLLLAGCGGSPEDDEAVEAAAVAFVQENGGVPGTAEVEEVSGDYARALVTPLQEGSTDPAWVFLRREGGTWQGLLYGTALAPELYRELGIPASLRPDRPAAGTGRR